MLHPSMSLLDFLAWLAASSVKGTVLIGAMTLLRQWLSPATASTLRYALWLPVLACLICPLGWHFRFTPDLRSSPPAEVAGAYLLETSVATVSRPTEKFGSPVVWHFKPATEATDAPPPLAGAAGPVPRAAHAISLAFLIRWLAFIWAAGAAVLASVYLHNVLKFRRIRIAAPAADRSAVGVLERCQAELRLRRAVTLLQSPDVDSPAIFGWWHPTLLLPLGLHERLEGARLRHVLLHELAHLKRNDVLINWLIALAQLLHWFNPVVWLATRLMRSDMESACDAFVLRHLSGSERGDYGEMLVQFADFHGSAIPPLYGLGIADRYTDLKGRLIMIARFRPASKRVKAGAGFAFVALTSLALMQPGFTSRAATGSDASHAMQRANSASKDSQPSGNSAGSSNVTMRELIEQVASNIHKRVVADPRAVGPVFLYGQRLDQITYPDFLTILRVNGFTAIELNGYIHVVPLIDVRYEPLPTITNGVELPDDQFADMSIALKNSCAPQLVPILRPLFAPYADLAADVRSNTLLAVDTYANLKRIRSIITELDARAKPGVQCGNLAKQAPRGRVPGLNSPRP